MTASVTSSLGQREVLDGRGVGRVGRRHDGEDVDDERQGVAGLDDVGVRRRVAVGEVGGDVELQLRAGGRADEALVPAGITPPAPRVTGNGAAP